MFECTRPPGVAGHRGEGQGKRAGAGSMEALTDLGAPPAAGRSTSTSTTSPSITSVSSFIRTPIAFLNACARHTNTPRFVHSPPQHPKPHAHTVAVNPVLAQSFAEAAHAQKQCSALRQSYLTSSVMPLCHSLFYLETLGGGKGYEGLQRA